jgi:hypothetical protein
MTVPETPEPRGFSWPVQTPPRAKRIESPGWKIIESTLVSDPQGAPVEVPLFASLPAPQST